MGKRSVRESIAFFFDVSVFSVYGGWKTGTVAGFLIGAVIGGILWLAFFVVSFIYRKLVPDNVRTDTINYLRGFLRKKPDIRRWVVKLIAVPLIGVLILMQVYGMFVQNTFIGYSVLVVLFLLTILVFLESTFVPYTGGKIIPYESVIHVLELNRKYERIQVHFLKAIDFFDANPDSDPQNCVKESVCALEAFVELLVPKKLSFLASIQFIRRTHSEQFPPTLSESMIKLYAYRGAGKGVAHAATEGGSKVSQSEAELVLNLTSAYILYLHDVFFSSGLL